MMKSTAKIVIEILPLSNIFQNQVNFTETLTDIIKIPLNVIK